MEDSKLKFLPLQGIKVLDLTKVLAGPICSQFLGDLGAEIIKVESMNGDDTRHCIPQIEGESNFFLGVNFNKRSIVLDLKNEAGQKLLRELVSDSDVVLQGYKKSTAHKLKVDYDTLRAINTSIIYCE